ncbi:MAG TPA: ribosome-associated translation inhibitor RaiA [Erythrobacter sp.]|nr:ribosome-associated translation inhibitor RaiA [Erythrobacter sp.]
MDIRVSGHQIETGIALQKHVGDRLGGIVDKYFDRALSSHITFGKAPAGAFVCDIVMHVMQGLILKSHAEAHDARQSFEAAAEKIEKQLRRYKRRLKDRHEQAAHAMRQEEAAYVIFASEEVEEEVTSDAPPIIAETSTDIPEASVADAVMMLDLRNTNALLFKNAGTGRHNMVYRRADGSIGWVEPR